MMQGNEEMFMKEHLSFASYFYSAGQVLKDPRYTDAYKLEFLESLHDLLEIQVKQASQSKA